MSSTDSSKTPLLQSPMINSNSTRSSSSSKRNSDFAHNPDNDANLEHAVNDFYEAVIQEEEDDDDEIDEDVFWLREQRDLNKTLHWAKRPSIVMIGICVFSIAFGNSSAQSTEQMITFKLACNYLIRLSNSNMCDPADTQVLVSNLRLCYNIAGAIATIFASGKIGTLSDKYGRKPFIVLLIACFLLAEFMKFLIMYNFSFLRFRSMVLVQFINNMAGGVITMITITNCYITDVVEPHERIYSLGLSIASLLLGFSTGPLVGNFLLRLGNKFGTPSSHMEMTTITTFSNISKYEFIPMKFYLCCLTLILLFAIFLLPESRSAKARRKSRSSSQSLVNLLLLQQQPQESLFERFKNGVNFLKPVRLLLLPKDTINPSNLHRLKKDRTAVIVLVVIECLLSGLSMVAPEINVLYGVYKYNWTSADIGHLLALSCSTKAFVLLVLSPIISHKLLRETFGFKIIKKQFDMIDFSMAFLGFVCEGIGFTIMAFAKTTNVFFLSLIFTSFGGLTSPSLNSSIIKFFPESKVGELFGGMTVVKNIFALIAPLVLLNVYKKAVSVWGFPGLPYLICSGMMFLSAISMLVVKKLLELNVHLNPTILTRSHSAVGLNASQSQTLQSDTDNRSRLLSRSGSIGDLNNVKSSPSQLGNAVVESSSGKYKKLSFSNNQNDGFGR